MKGFFALSAVLLVVCLWQGVEAAETGCDIHGKHVEVGEHVDHECARYTCTGNGEMSGKTCAVYQCAEEIGYKEQDPSKPYPECCGGPICKKD